MTPHDLIYRQRMAGVLTAINVTLSVLIEQSPSRTQIIDRLRLLAEKMEKEPNQQQLVQDRMTGEALRSILVLGDVDKQLDQPASWKPEIIQGGREDPEKPS